METQTTQLHAADLYKQACQVIPGGVSRNTIYHRPFPQYVSHASGCRVTDLDGVERIDFANNMASLIHGHAHPAIVEAVTEQIRKGTAYTMATEAELRLAQILCSRNRGFEKIRFTNSGTEAVMAMIKAARAFTGKPKIAKAEGAYHGTYDYAEVSQAPGPDTWGDPDHPRSVPLAHGTPAGVLEDVIIFPYNDTERTLRILDRHKNDLAAVLIDPVPHRVGLVPGDPGFIEAIYQWTREHGALMIFDEVITFRVHLGGAQEDYPVRPDLTALGKIIGGGFPVGAFTGRADIMKVLDPGEKKLLFPHSGTFSANPVTMTAGRTAMELYDDEAVTRLNEQTRVAKKQIEEAIRLSGVPVCLTGSGSMFRLHLRNQPPKNFRDAWQDAQTSQLIKEILDYLFFTERIMLINTVACMFSTAITQSETDHLSEAFLRMFRRFKDSICQLQHNL